jgi:glycosyltransferase involved in cell wall biosynthesis
MKSPLVSVIIPCFNVSAYVTKAILSIISQSYNNLEILIIDDASTDDTLAQIRSIKDDRITLFEFKQNTQKIGGVNEVLQKSRGDYILFQDADDWSEPNRIEEQLKEFEADKELGICFTNFRYTGKKIFLPGKLALTNDELRNGFFNFFYPVENKVTLPVCAGMMISKDALNQTKGYHPYFAGRVGEDIHWVYRILKHFKGITINTVLYNYVIREGSLTQLQFAGREARYTYSWQLLSKIIHKDIYEGIDVLDPVNVDLLKQLELEACEEALVQNIQLFNETTKKYKNSVSFKIGRFILTPLRWLKSIKNKYTD